MSVPAEPQGSILTPAGWMRGRVRIKEVTSRSWDWGWIDYSRERKDWDGPETGRPRTTEDG